MTKSCKGQEALDLTYLADYISLVEEHKYPYCVEQYQLIDYVKRMFLSEDIYIDAEQADKYFSYEKYFPFGLFPWEKFVFVLHNCTYTASGSLRWPVLFLYVGRGTGKNGYLGFEDFCLLTPTNGIKHYNIDILQQQKIKQRPHSKTYITFWKTIVTKCSGSFTGTKK